MNVYFYKIYYRLTMTCAGKLEQSDLTEYIIPAYNNFSDTDFDVSDAMEILKNFIVRYCKTDRQQTFPDDIYSYIVEVIDDNGLIVTINGNEHISFLVDIKTGKIYVAEHISNTEAFIPSISFDFLLLTYQTSPIRLPTRLISPKM